MLNNLVNALVNMQEDEALRIVKEAIDKGADPHGILDACQEAMKIIGDKYEKQEYFLPELVMSGEMLKSISEIVKPKLVAGGKEGGGGARRGKIVLGTVRGDIHDLGKDIVGFMLDVNGFEVHDLGVDVPEDRFVQEVGKVKPQVVALSGFLTLAYDTMKSTVEALEKAGLRKGVKVMIGGGQINEMVKDYAKADGYGSDAMAAVRMAREWIPGVK
ncbi:MAG: cobalamin B12-binding domain-containing protein [Chloroflexi bacterium]|nr:cobalamin B12-binding domain-containing protein [Chloroflexota bacterium]